MILKQLTVEFKFFAKNMKPWVNQYGYLDDVVGKKRPEL